jgi:hypothetical protein
MRTIAVLLLLSSCAFGQDKAAVSAATAACGPRNMAFEVTADESRHPTPAAENGKAVIYVVQGIPGTTRVGSDGKWLGALRRGTYLSVSVDPGEYHLCGIASIGLVSFTSLHELKAKAGETYYFVVCPVGEVASGDVVLSQVDPDEGKYLVAKAKLSASHPK